MAILSDYEEAEPVKKPFNAVLDSSNPLQFIQTAFDFVARETDLFKKVFVIKDVNGLVRLVKENVDSDERKRKEKSVPAATNGSAGAGVKVDHKRAKEESALAGPSQTGSSVKEPKDQKVEETNNDDKNGLREAEPVKKPFNAVLDSSNPLQFIQTAFDFVARETDLFKKDIVIKDVNGLVRSVKEKVDSDERKCKEKSVPATTNGSARAGVKADHKGAKEESSLAGPSQTGSSVKGPKDQNVEETNNDDKNGLRVVHNLVPVRVMASIQSSSKKQKNKLGLGENSKRKKKPRELSDVREEGQQLLTSGAQDPFVGKKVKIPGTTRLYKIVREEENFRFQDPALRQKVKIPGLTRVYKIAGAKDDTGSQIIDLYSSDSD